MSGLRASCRFLFVFILLMCLSMPVFAAEPPPEFLEEVVVTATKTPVPVSRLTSAVEVIKGEELEHKKIKTVADALRLAQAVTINGSGGPGTLTTARIRGGESAHTLVLMDGVILNSSTAGLFDFGNLTTENIERIEILRGAQSMLWGSDALGGVIHIITKKGADEFTASTFVEYGSFVTLREGINVSGKKGPFDLAVSATQWDASGFSAVNSQRSASERDGFHNFQTSARTGLTLPGDGRLDVTVRYWKAKTDIDSGGAGATDVTGSQTLDHRLLLSGSYDQPITSWWSHTLTLARDRQFTFNLTGGAQRNVATNVVSSPAGAGGNSNLENLNHRVESQHTFKIAKPLTLVAGYQFREGVGDSPNFSASSRSKVVSSHAGFADLQATILDKIFLTGGLRHDVYNSAFGEATTYRVTAGYLLNETGTKFRTSHATGFRAPTINDLFFPGFSNPNLKPEKSQSMDFGVDQKLAQDKLTVSAGFFWNRFRDLIQSPAPAFIPFNIAKAVSKGWETGFQFAATENLSVSGQYTKTMTRNLETTLRLAQRPVDQASAGISYRPIEPLRVNFDYRFVGGRVNNVLNTEKMLSFDVVNVSASYDVTKQWQVFTRVENLFDKDYEEIQTFGTPTRSVFAGVKFTY